MFPDHTLLIDLRLELYFQSILSRFIPYVFKNNFFKTILACLKSQQKLYHKIIDFVWEIPSLFNESYNYINISSTGSIFDMAWTSW